MAKRKVAEKFAVIVDVNAIFAPGPVLVARGFESALLECRELADINLVVPEIVKSERIYQLALIVEQSAENAGKNFETIASLTGIEFAQLPAVTDLRLALDRKFDSWLSKNGATLFPTPITKIDWAAITRDAVWRNAPFSSDGEKGFRDCLIFETLKEISALRDKETLVLISKDGLLSTAAKAHFTGKIAVYPEVREFLSNLRLKHEKLTEEFIKIVSAKAPHVFYSPNSPGCVWNVFRIWEQVAQKFTLNFIADPSASKSPFKAAFFVSNFILKDQRDLLKSTEFSNKRSDETFEWKTEMEHARLFVRCDLIGRPTQVLGGYMDETVRVSKVIVVWTARVSDDGNFSDLKVKDINVSEEATESALFKNRFGFPETPPPSPPPPPPPPPSHLSSLPSSGSPSSLGRYLAGLGEQEPTGSSLGDLLSQLQLGQSGH